MKHYLGLVLRRLADEKGLRQAHLAKEMHRAPGVVAQWWHGKVMPDTESLLALAKMFGTTHAALMEGAQRLLMEARGAPAVGRVDVVEVTNDAPPAVDPDARKLADHLAQELTHELRNHPQRRQDLLRHWYGQIAVTRWPAIALPSPPLTHIEQDDVGEFLTQDTKFVPIERPIELAKARPSRRRVRSRKPRA